MSTRFGQNPTPKVSRGAEHTFFKFGVNSGYSWWSTARSCVLAVIGVGIINQLCRGNVMGHVSEDSEVYIPVPLMRSPEPRKLPPVMDGFVGDENILPKAAK